jgi:Ribbon-helix-helix protein, copG family
MAIVSKPKRAPTDTAKPDPMEFIQGAEREVGNQAAAEISQPLKRRRKEPVIIRFDDEILSRLDKAAAKRGLSRAALVRLLVMEHLPD